MQTLKIIAALLHYPNEDLQAHAQELVEALAADTVLTQRECSALSDFIEHLQRADLIDAQAEYVETFERGRARSLYLFEHVHGESRDRGQAMVELVHIYAGHGYTITARELPDYLPLYLEFLSTLPDETAIERLADTAELLQMLHARLDGRGSLYAVLFNPLLRLTGVDQNDARVRAEVAAETPDDTRQALDAVWMEAPVSFGPDGGCGPGAQTDEVAVPWHGARSR